MAVKKTIEIDVNTKNLDKLDLKLEDLQESIQDVGNETKEVAVQTEELGGTLDTVTGGAITKFKGFKGSLKGVIGSFKTLKGAIIATGIGALIIAVTSLTQAFTASEEGQNRFAKILKQLGVVAGNIGDIFYSLGDTIFNVFTGNFEEAGKAFETFQDRIKNFGKETTREIELAGELADKIAEANKQERDLLVERAQTNVEINKLKTKAAEVDKFTAEQRIFFLEKAASLEDEITAKEVNLAKLRRDIKIEENTLSESTKEDLDEEAQLIANVIQLEEQRLIRNKELLGVAAGLRKTEADLKAAERKAEIDAFQKQQDTISGILKDNIVKNNDFAISAEKDVNSKLKGLLEKKADEEEKIDKLSTEAKINLASNALGDLASVLGEESKAGKAAAIAQTTIETYKGATAAYASLAGVPIVGPGLGAIAAAAALAAGFKNIQAIQQQGPSVGGAPSAPSATPRGAQAPSFNIVGAAPENQLAQAIGENNQKPVKAFVVSSEVSNQQALDRKIETGSSIG
jgi:uncharacterized protein YukE